MNKLEEIAKSFSGILGEKMKSVTAVLQIMHSNILYKNLIDFEKKTLTIKHTVTEVKLDGKITTIAKDNTKIDKIQYFQCFKGSFLPLPRYGLVGIQDVRSHRNFSNRKLLYVVNGYKIKSMIAYKFSEKLGKRTTLVNKMLDGYQYKL